MDRDGVLQRQRTQDATAVHPAPKAPPVDPEILRLRRQEVAKRSVEINAKKREEKVNSLNYDIQKKPLNLITSLQPKVMTLTK